MVRARTPRLDSLEDRALLSALVVESEPNNRPATADVVSFDSDAAVVGSTRAGNPDYFVIPVTATGTMTLGYTSRGKGIAKLEIDDAGGRTLFQGPVRAVQRSASFAVTAGDTLTVRLVGTSARVTPYRLTFVAPATAPGGGSDPIIMPFARPNAAPSSPFDASGHANFTGTLSSATDADVHPFTAPKSGRLTVVARRSATPVTVRVLDAAGRSLLTVYSDIPTRTASLNVVGGQSYTLQVTPRTSAAGSYEVNLTLV